MGTCAACGAVLPEAARLCPVCAAPVELKRDERERKLATIVFADLVGSTELGGSQDPERTRALLDRFYDAMAAEIDNAGGTVEKFAGDAVMAVFGACGVPKARLRLQMRHFQCAARVLAPHTAKRREPETARAIAACADGGVAERRPAREDRR